MTGQDLRDRDVHRHRRRVRPRPEHGGAAGLEQHEAADGDDLLGLLGDRDEDLGADPAELRMGPAQQRLHHVAAAGGGVDDRLVVQRQRAVARRPAQALLDQAPLADQAGELGVEHRQTAAPVLLAGVHRDVGGADQLVLRAAVPRAQRHADGDADAHRAPAALRRVGLDRRGENAADPLRERQHLGLLRAARGHDDELVAAPARDEGPEAALHQPRGDDAQHVVAHVVALQVVDLLEPVEVEEQHREPGLGLCRTLQQLAQALRQCRPVEQAGQRIGRGQAGERLCVALALHDLVPQVRGMRLDARLQRLVGLVQRRLGDLQRGVGGGGAALLQDRVRHQQLVAARQPDQVDDASVQHHAGAGHHHRVEQAEHAEREVHPARPQQEHQRERQDQRQAVADRHAGHRPQHDRAAAGHRREHHRRGGAAGLGHRLEEQRRERDPDQRRGRDPGRVAPYPGGAAFARRQPPRVPEQQIQRAQAEHHRHRAQPAEQQVEGPGRLDHDRQGQAGDRGHRQPAAGVVVERLRLIARDQAREPLRLRIARLERYDLAFVQRSLFIPRGAR